MGFSSPVSITYIRAAEIPERPRRSALAKVGRSFGRRCGSTRRPSNLFTSEHGSLQSRNCWNNTASFSCESRGYTIYRCKCPDVQPPHALGRHCKPGLSLHHCREPLGTITARGMDLSLLETPQDFASLHRTCNKVGPHVGAPARDRHSPILVLLMSSSADGSLDACKPAYESSMGNKPSHILSSTDWARGRFHNPNPAQHTNRQAGRGACLPRSGEAQGPGSLRTR
jgi:hypothetical protein